MVEDNRYCPEDLTICNFKCRLQKLHKRLLFVGEWHPDGLDSDGKTYGGTPISILWSGLDISS